MNETSITPASSNVREHTPTTPRLIQFTFSPWSERARWALDHCSVAWQRDEYISTLSTLRVRLATRRFTGKLTVPILIAGDVILTDSWDIARYANTQRQPDRTNLFPEQHTDHITAWNRKSEEILGTLRIDLLHRMKSDHAAQVESLPDAIPASLKPHARFAGRFACSVLLKKYQDRYTGRAQVEAHLNSLRDALAEQGGDYLLGQFSYADIVMCTALQAVTPVDSDLWPILPAQRRCATDPELSAAYSDLLAWRDRIYQRHR